MKSAVGSRAAASVAESSKLMPASLLAKPTNGTKPAAAAIPTPAKPITAAKPIARMPSIASAQPQLPLTANPARSFSTGPAAAPKSAEQTFADRKATVDDVKLNIQRKDQCAFDAETHALKLGEHYHGVPARQLRLKEAHASEVGEHDVALIQGHPEDVGGTGSKYHAGPEGTDQHSVTHAGGRIYDGDDTTPHNTELREREGPGPYDASKLSRPAGDELEKTQKRIDDFQVKSAKAAQGSGEPPEPSPFKIYKVEKKPTIREAMAGFFGKRQIAGPPPLTPKK
ncbi:MAG: hypothetical protein ACJ768_02850 [Gaiellaceae bacterium]